MEPKKSRIESKPHELNDDFRSSTKDLVDSMMGEICQVLNSYFKQLNHMTTDGNKGDVPSSPPLIEEKNEDSSKMSE